ncbi:MAG: polymerase III gamma and tau subunit protein [Parcubacteria group bacterium GW2011_GWC1_45_9]|uniref:DNA polymerase III subunit gamma/tau n=1 Tax=Candidatus Woesebacteria bacterium GW2011_GWB1_44_11b TaxID=1618580 RepID=A0A0G1GHB9_9BACT|nr:MAG: polymerase III gamma and tau subunit protein [Candidatus Woesebacteria bacterium GW2011_GWB1_44_11b]KKU17076.1 MAG: polymerase III gamma and tau subunit protein [Parcubacteria group bacterium GW2011_GWC1_45_9]
MIENHEHSLVFYRKYRPLKFSDFINQESVKRTLQNALLLNKISHAYLFAGVRGTGKTTMARLFAKAINCLGPEINRTGQNQYFEPCNKCEICQEISRNHSVDLIEIDAASNRGIDEIRDLKEGIRFSPVKSKYKVFIIDESHMLTPAAFNALLKTLEEPPAHAIFILATTEAEKLPATILSRVQRFDFRRLPVIEIVKKLKQISEKEKFAVDELALKAIARSSEGSIRDAESILSQVVAFSYDKKITLSEVESVLGIIRFEKIKDFLEFLAENDIEQSVRFVNFLQQEGFQLHEVMKIVIGFLEKILLLKLDPAHEKSLKSEFNSEEIAVLKLLSGKFNLQILKTLLKEFMLILPNIKKSIIPSLPIELVIVETLSNT